MSFRRILGRVAGLILIIPASSVVLAQDYIDVEAERERARTSQADSSLDRPARVTPESRSSSPGGARSYGLDSQPAKTVFRDLPDRVATDTQQNVGDLFVRVQELRQEVMRLNGLVEEQANEIRTLKEQSLERYMDLDRRLAGGGASASMPVSGGAKPSEARMQAGDVSAEQPGEGDAYRAAYALVRSQEFDDAVTSFKQFLQRYPDGRYAPNAHYWLGELYLVVKPAAPELARQSFTLLLDEYPDNAKVPDAMYKLGQVHYVKGNRDRAREYLNRVIREHGDAAAASLAREFIDQNL